MKPHQAQSQSQSTPGPTPTHKRPHSLSHSSASASAEVEIASVLAVCACPRHCIGGPPTGGLELLHGQGSSPGPASCPPHLPLSNKSSASALARSRTPRSWSGLPTSMVVWTWSAWATRPWLSSLRVFFAESRVSSPSRCHRLLARGSSAGLWAMQGGEGKGCLRTCTRAAVEGMATLCSAPWDS